MARARFNGRVLTLVVVVVLVFAGIGFRLARLHLCPADWVLEPIERGRMFEKKPMGARGKIVDRNGRVLAMDIASHHVYVDPWYIAKYGDAVAVAEHLSRELRVPRGEIERMLADTSDRYEPVKKYVPAHQLKRFRRGVYGVTYTPEELVGGVETNILLRGVGLEEAPIRSYPNGPLMAHVVGFANKEGVGSAGIEQRYDQVLRGKEGHRVSMLDGRRREMYNYRSVDVPAQDGATVRLTLDRELQFVVERVIEKTCREVSAKAMWAIVQRVRTGEILAMASFPSYDPNSYWKAPEEWRRNRAISFNYEPGSTMKAAVIAAAMDRGVVTAGQRFDCENGYWVYGGSKLEDSHPHGLLAVSNIVKVSSNIGTAKIALEMGNQRLYDSLRGFHFGERLGVGLPGEEGGIFYSPRNWSKISATRIGMGHEIAVTSLQVLSMMNAIAYNGVQMKPYLVRDVVAADGEVVRENHPEVLGRALRGAGAALKMRRMLRAVVHEEGGTAPGARVEGYEVGGKTGTAQKLKPDGSGYYRKNFTSSFVGFLPVEHPEIGIIVVADDPGTYNERGWKINYSGGKACAPAFREIAEFAVRYLRIAPDGERIYVTGPN